MKKVFFLFLAWFCYSGIYAQNRNPCVFISNDNMNILYTGISNPVTVHIEGNSNINLTTRFSGGGDFKVNFSSPGMGHYLIIPDGSKKIIELTAFNERKNGEKQILAKQEFRVLNIPPPDVEFGTKKTGEILKSEAEGVNKIAAEMPEGFVFSGLQYQISHYRLIIVRQNGENYFEEVDGQNITDAGRQALRSVSKGDVIVISNVTANGNDKKILLKGLCREC